MTRGTRRGRVAVRVTGLLAGLLAGGALAADDSHGRDFWRALRARHFAVAVDQSVLPLALEATRLLGATDPELRDAIGYEALAAWIYDDRRLDAAALAEVRSTLAANATRDLGEPTGDGLFLRSFSALALSVIAAADLRDGALSAADFDALVDLATTALARERDLRGYVPGKGWGHATAHVADLLKFLARNPRLRREQQARIVAAIATRLETAGEVFTWGEDERLAAALAALVRRTDADPAPFEAWLVRLAQDHAAVWRGAFDPARYVAVRAQLNAAAALAAELESDSAPDAVPAVRLALRRLRDATR